MVKADHEKTQGRAHIAGDMIALLRFGACLVLAAAAFLQLGGTATAVAPAPEPRAFEPDCNPCVLVVDKAAWDETQTIVDTAAWDETVTVIDVPATTGTRIVVDAPARAVAHHDLVSAAHDVTTSTWVPETTSRWNTTSGAWMNTFVPAVTGLLYMPFSCWWEWDDGGRYRECDGGYYYGAVITPAHYENQWHQGHYVYQLIRECDDWCDVYWGNQWYEGPFWEAVDTSHYVYTTTHYDAVYNDWTQQIAAVTHTETYPIPAVTHQSTVHHAALTHTALVHHDAVTHQEQAPVVLSQSSQGSAAGDNANVPSASSTTPVTIPVVSTITLIDTPASTRTVTVTDAPAYTTVRTVVDQAAYDQAVQTPIYDVECDDSGRCHRYIDDWQTTYVHHDALTHQETVQVPAVTHQETQTVAAVTHTETLRFDAAIADRTARSNSDGLAGFALLAGLTALAGAGRYASKADALRVAVAEMAHLGEPIPAALEPILVDSSEATVASVESSVAAALADTSNAVIDPGRTDQTQPVDTPPDGRSTAEARRQFDAWLFDKNAAQYASLPDAIAVGGNGPATGTDNGAVRFGLGFLKSVTDAAVDTVAGTLKTGWAVEKFWFKTQTDPLGAAKDIANLVEHRNDIGRSFAYGAANAVDRLGAKLDSGDPGAVGEALGEIFVFSATAATLVEGGAGLVRSAEGAAVAVDGAVATDAALVDAGASTDASLIKYMSQQAWETARANGALQVGRDGVVYLTNDALVPDAMIAADTYGLPYVPEVAVRIPAQSVPNAVDNGVAKMLIGQDDPVIRLGGGPEVVSPTPITIPEDFAAAGFEVIPLDPPSCPLPAAVDLFEPSISAAPDLMPQIDDQLTFGFME